MGYGWICVKKIFLIIDRFWGGSENGWIPGVPD